MKKTIKLTLAVVFVMGAYIALRTEIRAHQHPGSYLGDAGNEGDADQHRSLQ